MGETLVQGFLSNQSAYRRDISEWYRMVVVIEMIKHIWGLTERISTLECDEINTLYEALDYEYRPASSSP